MQLGDDFVMTKGDFLKRIPRMFSWFSFLLPVHVYLDIHILIGKVEGVVTSALLSSERTKKRRKSELYKRHPQIHILASIKDSGNALERGSQQAKKIHEKKKVLFQIMAFRSKTTPLR